MFTGAHKIRRLCDDQWGKFSVSMGIYRDNAIKFNDISPVQSVLEIYASPRLIKS